MGSARYESWIARLRVAWMGAAARRIFGGFAAALGDKTYDWAEQGVLEHMPQYASDPASVALTADERQLDTYPGEPTAALAARAPYWLVINQFRGRGLGILLGLHFAGFDNAILVQQNGRALQLQLPLPPFSGNWDPTPNLIVTPTAALAVALASSKTPPTLSQAGRSIPVGNRWWTFDSDTDFCSRFAVIFPGLPPGPFVTWGRATFTGVENGAGVPWPLANWNNVFPDTSYRMKPCPPTITDGGGGVITWADANTKTTTGVRIAANAAFSGTVDVLAYQAGATNPFADPHPDDLDRLKATIAKWKPAKATCLGVFTATQGKFSAWPVGTMAQMLGVKSTIVQIVGGL